MKLSKLLVSCVAVGALAAACTTAAFADGVTATYKDGKVTISDFKDYADKAAGDLTLLILSADEAVTSENANTIIKQIDQFDITDGNYSKEVTVGELADNQTYYVRLGGAAAGVVTENGYVATTFSTGAKKPYAGSTHLIGDVNSSGAVDVGDFGDIKLYLADKETYALTGENYAAADVNDSGAIDVGDFGDVKLYLADKDTYPFVCTTLGEKNNTVN